MSEKQAPYLTSNGRARVDVARLVEPYKSKTEKAWSKIGALWVGDWYQSQVLDERYEPLTFRLLGGSYTPDFGYLLSDGRLVFVETKGSTHQKNYRDARSKIRAAAELYPWFIFCEARPVKGGNWHFEEIAP